MILTINWCRLANAFVGTASSIRIKSETHYNQLGYDDNAITGVTIAAKHLVVTQTELEFQ